MLHIQYPPPAFKIKKELDKEWIWDDIRKKWVRLTPEEWVRQNFVQYLIQVKNYPASLMAIEKEIRLGEISKRCDIVVYQKEAPYLIVECKEMGVPINQKTAEQIFRYNISLKATILVLTNGNDTLAVQIAEQQLLPLTEIPLFLKS